MISTRPEFRFEPKWKEELVCTTPWATFTTEITMGVLHVYFPDEEKWKKVFSAHLHDKWSQVVEELRLWCAKEKIPLTLCSDAGVTIHDQKTGE